MKYFGWKTPVWGSTWNVKIGIQTPLVALIIKETMQGNTIVKCKSILQRCQILFKLLHFSRNMTTICRHPGGEQYEWFFLVANLVELAAAPAYWVWNMITLCWHVSRGWGGEVRPGKGDGSPSVHYRWTIWMVFPGGKSSWTCCCSSLLGMKYDYDMLTCFPQLGGRGWGIGMVLPILGLQGEQYE